MEVTYASRIRKHFESPKSLQRAFPNHYVQIRQLLETLEEAEQVGNIVYGQPHPLKGARQGQLALNAGKGLRLVLEPGTGDPQHGAKVVRWRTVRAVKIVALTDYHS